MRVLPNKAKTQRFCHQPPFRGNRTTTAKRVAYLRYDMGTSAAHAEAPHPAAAAPEPMGRVDRGGSPPRPPSDPGGACQELSHAPIEPWWETNPARTPRQELGMVAPELRREEASPSCGRKLLLADWLAFHPPSSEPGKPCRGIRAIGHARDEPLLLEEVP